MEAADIAREIIAQSKGGVHVAFAFAHDLNNLSLEVRRNNLLFTSSGENGEKYYHVVTTTSDKIYEFKYSSADCAIALLALYDQHLSRGSFHARFVLYKKGDPNLVQLTTSSITLQRANIRDADLLWKRSIKNKLQLLEVVDLVESE